MERLRECGKIKCKESGFICTHKRIRRGDDVGKVCKKRNTLGEAGCEGNR